MAAEGIAATAGIARWCARLASFAVVIFLGLFAVESQDGNEDLLGRFMHLVPALIVVALLVLAWKRPWIGALGFAVLALLYAWMAHDRWDWVLLISGPLLLVAGVHVWAWIAGREG